MCEKQINTRVLIMDDDIAMLTQLAERYDAYNKDNENVKKSFPYRFEVEKLTDITKIKNGSDPLGYDIIVIDRKWLNTTEHLPIVNALFSLRVTSIRIIWTAYYNEDDMKECFRLGVYDYIDKKITKKMVVDGDHEVGLSTNCYNEVVNSTVRGLENKRKKQEKESLDMQGYRYVHSNYGAIYKNYRKHYLALKQTDKQNNKWVIVSSSSGLVSLYYDLEDKKIDKDQLHITLVED